MSREYPCIYYDNGRCKKFNEPGYIDYCVLGPCAHETPSNADRIRAMSDENLAAWIASMTTVCKYCAELNECESSKSFNMCSHGVEEWLKQPAE